jgi:hypothetical protein
MLRRRSPERRRRRFAPQMIIIPFPRGEALLLASAAAALRIFCNRDRKLAVVSALLRGLHLRLSSPTLHPSSPPRLLLLVVAGVLS